MAKGTFFGILQDLIWFTYCDYDIFITKKHTFYYISSPSGRADGRTFGGKPV